MNRGYNSPHGLGQLPPSRTRNQRGPMVGIPYSEEPGGWVNPYTSTQYSFNASTAPLRVIAGNMRRTYLIIQNLEPVGGNPIYVGIGTEPTPANGFMIAPDGGWIEFTGGANGGSYCPRSDIYVVSVGPAIGVILEGAMIPREQLERV
jgi:hypothetical protein